MATYVELRSLFDDSDLKNKINVAVIVAAETIRNESDTVPNHANRLKWAKRAFEDPSGVTSEMLMGLLAQNKDASLAVITGASDSVIQTNVNNTVNVFADGS